MSPFRQDSGQQLSGMPSVLHPILRPARVLAIGHRAVGTANSWTDGEMKRQGHHATQRDNDTAHSGRLWTSTVALLTLQLATLGPARTSFPRPEPG